MKVAIGQVRGGSGVDIWAGNLCRGLRWAGQACSVDMAPPIYQFFPFLVRCREYPFLHCDIIHGNSWNAFAFKRDSPLVVTEHHVIHDPLFNPYRSLPQKMYHRWIYHCEKRSFRAADAITCVSWYTRKKMEECFGLKDSRVIYNGVDTTVFQPVEQISNSWNLPDGKTILFFAGNLSRRKGGDLLPAIMKELGDDFILLIATGQKGATPSAMNTIMNLGQLDISHLVLAYNRCDIFLSASRLEGFGLSVAEAMSCGKPVVATNGSSLPELVIDGKGGFLCQMDDVRDFAEKIRELAADENLRNGMGKFNRKRVKENFTLGRMVGDYIRLYRSLL